MKSDEIKRLAESLKKIENEIKSQTESFKLIENENLILNQQLNDNRQLIDNDDRIPINIFNFKEGDIILFSVFRVGQTNLYKAITKNIEINIICFGNIVIQKKPPRFETFI